MRVAAMDLAEAVLEDVPEATLADRHDLAMWIDQAVQEWLVAWEGDGETEADAA